MKLSIFCPLLVLILSIKIQESVPLAIHLKKGDTYLATIITKNSNSTTSDRTNYETLTVKDFTDNGFLVELEVDRIVMNTTNNGIPIHYDSSVDIAKMGSSAKGLHSRFKPILNTVISEIVDKNGVASNRTKVSGQLNAQMAPQKTNLIKLPTKPVSVDSEWQQDVKNGKIELTYTYLVSKIAPTKVYLECLGIPKGTLKGTVEGTIEIERTTGIPLKKELKLDLNLSGQVIQSEIIVTIEKV